MADYHTGSTVYLRNYDGAGLVKKNSKLFVPYLSIIYCTESGFTTLQQSVQQ